MTLLARLIVFVFTFSAGVLFYVTPSIPLAFLILLLIGIPSIITSIVIYQGLYLKYPWRPAIGKGFLAIFLWLFSSLIIVVFAAHAILMLDPVEKTDISTQAFTISLWINTLPYTTLGVALCHWVNRRSDQNHWLLRNNQ